MVLRLPVKLDTTSNGEFEPIPLEFVHERANRLAHEFATDTVLSHRAETFFRREVALERDRPSRILASASARLDPSRRSALLRRGIAARGVCGAARPIPG
jgi:hypothetical protein